MRPAILHHGVTHVHRDLDEKRMHEAAQALLGEQDFSASQLAQGHIVNWRCFVALHVFYHVACLGTVIIALRGGYLSLAAGLPAARAGQP